MTYSHISERIIILEFKYTRGATFGYSLKSRYLDIDSLNLRHNQAAIKCLVCASDHMSRPPEYSIQIASFDGYAVYISESDYSSVIQSRETV